MYNHDNILEFARLIKDCADSNDENEKINI